MNVDKKKVGIITTVSNWDLYNKSLPFFPSDIKLFAIDGTKGFYGINSIRFFMKKLKKYDLDWLIMADEDVIFTNPENVFDLIGFMEKEGYAASGMRDGGVLKWRDKNPYLLNTFFTILNLKEIFPIYDEGEMMSNQYILENEFQEDLVLPFKNYQKDSLFESYYCFFLWLLRKGKKIYYLKGLNPFPNETTLVLDHKERELLYHSWYARLYNQNEYHTERINFILKKGRLNRNDLKPIVFKNHSFHLKKFIRKQLGRIMNKLKTI